MRAGSKYELVANALAQLPVGKSIFTMRDIERVYCYWTLTHERFLEEDGSLNIDDPGDLESIKHIEFWLQPDMGELKSLVARYESESGRVFAITQKTPGRSKMTRIMSSE